MERKAINRPVAIYLVFFVFMVMYSYFFIATTKEFSKESLNTLEFRSISLTLYFYIQFFLFQGITVYVMSSFSRLDGYFYLPGKDAYTVSRKKFIKSNTKLIKLFVLSFFPFLFTFISNENITGVCLILLVAANSFLLFFIVKSNIDHFIKIKKIHTPRIGFYILSIIVIFVGMYMLVSTVSLFVQQILVVVFLFIYFLFVITSFIVDLFNKKSKTRKFFLNLVLNEYLIANQSKKNAANFALIQYLIDYSSKKLSYYPHDFLKKIKGPYDRIFLKSDIQDSAVGESTFLELRKYQDFKEFIDKAREIFNDDYRETIDQLELDYQVYGHNMNALLMETRTGNIKQRNWNNLILGLCIFIISGILVLLFELNIVQFVLLYIVMWTVFLRMVLRTLDIGRAFYNDITDSGYSKSFLSGPDRIVLAIKSVIEIAFLAGSIYLIQLTQADDWELTFNAVFKVIEYSFAVLLFNVSFPEGFSEAATKPLVWLSAHLIQVISSVILITISITGYISRKHPPVYFEYDCKNKDLHVLKKNYRSPSKYKTVLIIQEVALKDKLEIKRKIESELKCLYKNNKIREEDFDQITKEIDEWV